MESSEALLYASSKTTKQELVASMVSSSHSMLSPDKKRLRGVPIQEMAGNTW